jgi:hypothetical protein
LPSPELALQFRANRQSLGLKVLSEGKLISLWHCGRSHDAVLGAIEIHQSTVGSKSS